VIVKLAYKLLDDGGTDALKLTYALAVFLLTALFAVADETPTIRICIGPLEDHSGYQLAIDKIQADLASQLSHKHIKAVNIPGHDFSAEMDTNNCEYLLLGEFSKLSELPTCPKCPVVDERKYFALQFGFALRKSAAEQPLYSHKGGVIDKNPKTCVDDHIFETVRFVREYFKTLGKAT
jgi:hypothetical protein